MRFYCGLIFVVCMLSGCIGDYGQYRGAANGVEMRQQPDGTKIINVSGEATATIMADGSVTAASKSNIDKVIQVLKTLQ